MFNINPNPNPSPTPSLNFNLSPTPNPFTSFSLLGSINNNNNNNNRTINNNINNNNNSNGGAVKYVKEFERGELILEKEKIAGVEMSHITCPICFDILPPNSAVEGGECGHAFCRRCIEPVVSHQRKCPLCRIPLSLSSLKPLNLILRNILSDWKVCCAYHDMGCEWKGTYGELEAHILSPSCLLRCSFCSQSIAAHAYLNHQRECEKSVKECELCHVSVCMRDLSSHRSQLCPMMMIDCPNPGCSQQCKRNEMSGHLKECSMAPKQCICNSFSGTSSEIDAHISSSLLYHLQLSIAHPSPLPANEKLEFQNNLSLLQSQITRLTKEKKTMETKLTMAYEKIFSLQRTLSSSPSSSYFWKINKIEEKYHKAPVIISPPFYLQRYRCILVVYLKGSTQEVKEKYISVHMSLTKGEYDDLLPWPALFSFKVTFHAILSSPSPSSDYSKVFSYDGLDAEFNGKPSKENKCFGSAAFIETSNMRPFLSSSSSLFISIDLL